MLQKVACDIRSTDHALTITRDGLISQTHLLSFNMGCLKTLRVDRRVIAISKHSYAPVLTGRLPGSTTVSKNMTSCC